MMSDEDKEAMKELVTAVVTNAVELPEGDAREEYLRDWHQEAEWDWRGGWDISRYGGSKRSNT